VRVQPGAEVGAAGSAGLGVDLLFEVVLHGEDGQEQRLGDFGVGAALDGERGDFPLPGAEPVGIRAQLGELPRSGSVR
jgi:hypothetical protein